MWAAGENHREGLGNPESEGLAKERNRPEGLLPFVCAESCVLTSSQAGQLKA